MSFLFENKYAKWAVIGTTSAAIIMKGILAIEKLVLSNSHIGIAEIIEASGNQYVCEG